MEIKKHNPEQSNMTAEEWKEHAEWVASFCGKTVEKDDTGN
tara:strand:- start:1424 stop:1546 length:123 start_codon:yes stop_codon:yes gene_type:complete